MNFKPLYFEDKIKIISRQGYIGIVTLWSNPEWIINKMKEVSIDLNSKTSSIAAISTLYGNGLPEILRNLLFNPQITHLIIAGTDKSSSAAELKNFFELGLEEVDFLGRKQQRIRKTHRIIDGLINPEMFSNKLIIHEVGKLKDAESIERLKDVFKNLKFFPCLFDEDDRVKIPLPEVKFKTFPSNPRNHNIVAKNALSGLKELIFQLVRFGRIIHLKKGDRMELQNIRVVVEKPDFIKDLDLKKFGYDSKLFDSYYKKFTDTKVPPDLIYTYGNRLGEYFNLNTIKAVIDNLKRDSEDRTSYIALWDSRKDITSPTGHPCLVSLFFRKFDSKLTLTAIFRTHNSLDAWLLNFYGLMRLQNDVSKEVEIEKGAITVISHSISIDPARFEIAKCFADQKKFAVNPDPCGYFYICIDNDEIVVKHYFEGIQIDEYRGKKASRLQHELNRNCALSDINHAIYIGRMLERVENKLKGGRIKKK